MSDEYDELWATHEEYVAHLEKRAEAAEARVAELERDIERLEAENRRLRLAVESSSHAKAVYTDRTEREADAEQMRQAVRVSGKCENCRKNRELMPTGYHICAECAGRPDDG